MQILKTTLGKVAILLVVLTTVSCLQVNAIPISNPMVLANHSSLVENNRVEKHDKAVKARDVSMANSNAALVAFPSKNILLGILLIGVYILFVRKSIGSRKADL